MAVRGALIGRVHTLAFSEPESQREEVEWAIVKESGWLLPSG